MLLEMIFSFTTIVALSAAERPFIGMNPEEVLFKITFSITFEFAAFAFEGFALRMNMVYVGRQIVLVLASELVMWAAEWSLFRVNVFGVMI